VIRELAMEETKTSKEQIQGINTRVPFVSILPNGEVHHFEVLDSSRSLTMRSGLVTLQPGQDVGFHNTGRHEELIVVLQGDAEVEAEGLGRQKIADSHVVYIPPGTKHNVFNVGSQPLRYIYIVART